RTAVECPAMADRARPSLVEDVHHVGPPTERGKGVPAADDLAKRGEIGPDAEQRLGAAMRHPERDDLVEDQQRSVTVRERTEERQEAGFGRADAARALDGLDDDRCEVILATPKGSLDAVRVAPRQVDDQAAHSLRDACGPDHDTVVSAVIRAIKPRDE